MVIQPSGSVNNGGFGSGAGWESHTDLLVNITHIIRCIITSARAVINTHFAREEKLYHMVERAIRKKG